jgi:ferredoxin
LAYKIGESCIACGACISECPNGAIREGNVYCYIITDRCTECVGAHQKSQCLIACPIEAPQPDPEHKESHEELLAKWKKLHPNKQPMYE